MGRELNMDTQRQNFWKQAIAKEDQVRFAWHTKYSKAFAEETGATQRNKSQQQTLKPALKVTDLPPIDHSKFKKKGLRIYTPPKVDPEELSNKSKLLTEMRPVSKDTKKLLYKGFSALGEGRHAYLNERKGKIPEQKYDFPITSSWEYGWKISDIMKNASLKPAQFARGRIVQDTFYTRNGVFPVVDWILYFTLKSFSKLSYVL